MLGMPGKSFRGQAPPLTLEEVALRDTLSAHVHALADEIGERNLQRCYMELCLAAEYIEHQLRSEGYHPERQQFGCQGKLLWNTEVEIKGTEEEKAGTVVIGAHYDTVSFSPGANDNASAVAVGLALAHAFSVLKPKPTVRFVFFVNEEAPYFGTLDCGSVQYAQRCLEREENIAGMICLECVGSYFDAPKSQKYPAGLGSLYPDKGNFAAFVGNYSSRRFTKSVVSTFREHADLPSEGIAIPALVRDLHRSDHASFWACGYPALMVTDTANFRYEHYHTPQDTPDKVNFEELTRLTIGLSRALTALYCR